MHYLIHRNDGKYYENYFIMPMCPIEMEGIAADIFAIFLLIPMRQFLKEFTEYVEYRMEKQRLSITTEEWIKYLSERSVLSDYYVAYGYQYLRGIAFWVYQAWLADKVTMRAIGMTEKDRKEIKDWMKGCNIKKMEKYLFQK